MIGIDEVGRGAWAGPLLVVAAQGFASMPLGLTDSKKLSSEQRLKLLNKLNNCCNFGEGWVTAAEIDGLGLAGSLRVGAKRALSSLSADIGDKVIIDGKVNFAPAGFKRVSCLVDADEYVPLVSAASIYAKVRRDCYMKKLGAIHADYKFENHVGYGTAAHLQAIFEYGVLSNVHRMSFKPLADLSV